VGVEAGRAEDGENEEGENEDEELQEIANKAVSSDAHNLTKALGQWQVTSRSESQGSRQAMSLVVVSPDVELLHDDD